MCDESNGYDRMDSTPPRLVARYQSFRSLDETIHRRLAAAQLERHHRAVILHLAGCQFVVSVAGQAGIVNVRDLGMLLQGVGNRRGVAAGPLHPQVQCFQTTQQ